MQIMQIQVKVFLTSDAHKPVFERIFGYNRAMSVDFGQIDSVMRILFGRSCVVTFKIFEL